MFLGRCPPMSRGDELEAFNCSEETIQPDEVLSFLEFTSFSIQLEAVKKAHKLKNSEHDYQSCDGSLERPRRMTRINKKRYKE